MGYLTIADSTQERDIVYIGATPRANLRQRLTDRIDDPCLKTNPISQHENCQLSPAEQAVLSSGRQLYLSWAVTENNDSAKYHETALIRAYKEQHGQLPSWDSSTGWVRGNSQQPQREGPVGPLDWSDWKPLAGYPKDSIPIKPGVYRIRAVRFMNPSPPALRYLAKFSQYLRIKRGESSPR